MYMIFIAVVWCTALYGQVPFSIKNETMLPLNIGLAKPDLERIKLLGNIEPQGVLAATVPMMGTYKLELIIEPAGFIAQEITVQQPNQVIIIPKSQEQPLQDIKTWYEGAQRAREEQRQRDEAAAARDSY